MAKRLQSISIINKLKCLPTYKNFHYILYSFSNQRNLLKFNENKINLFHIYRIILGMNIVASILRLSTFHDNYFFPN